MEIVVGVGVGVFVVVALFLVVVTAIAMFQNLLGDGCKSKLWQKR